MLKDKLGALDPKNDDHWTEDGLPALSALGKGVKRAEVTAIAPALTREHPGFTAAPPVASDVGEFGDAGQAASDKEEAASFSDGPSKEDIADELAARKALELANAALTKAKQAVASAGAAHRVASGKLVQSADPHKDAKTIKSYLASQMQIARSQSVQQQKLIEALKKG